MIRPSHALALSLTLFALGGCKPAEPEGLSELALQGQRVYQNVCIACHNGNPALDGSVGPANAGASLALLEAKILRAEYPPGYTPKRAGVSMPKFEYLKDQIPALHAYLNEAPQALQ
jgi:mono/diheme cytochrome c family protein